MKWIQLKDLKLTRSEFIYVHAHDIVSSWVEVVNAYVCPEYGNIILEDVDGDDYAPIVLEVAYITDESLPDKPIQ